MDQWKISENEENLPIAIGEVIPPMTYFKFRNHNQFNSKGWKVKVLCPYGKRNHEHIHGWGPDNLPDDPGQTRQSHCQQGQYRIVIIDQGEK